MRMFIALFSLLSFSAIACPNLAGTYSSCRSLSGQTTPPRDMIVSQQVINKITVYTVQSNEEDGQNVEETYKADGKVYSQTMQDPDSEMTLRNDVTTTCAGNTLKIKMVASMNGTVAMNATMDISKNAKQELVNVTVIKIPQTEQTIKETIICE